VSSAPTKQDVTHPMESSLHHYSTADRTEPVPPVSCFPSPEGRPPCRPRPPSRMSPPHDLTYPKR